MSSDELKGRGSGSNGILEAARYIEKQFKQIGLKPYSQQTYLQPVAIADPELRENNVIGWLQAAEETSRSLVFMALYDGLGVRTGGSEGDDVIFNGARDNATGVAALIELARRLAQRPTINHNIVFIATTLEEVNFGGSRQYVDSPLFPLHDISLVLNIDGFNVSGPRSDFFVMPRKGINMLNDIKRVALNLDWQYSPQEWVDVMNQRFDSAVMLSHGVPAITIWTGNTLKNGQPAPSVALGDIHSVEDEINEFWNWEGVDAHLSLYLAVANFYLEHPGTAKVTKPELFTVRLKDK
ncbi:M28 family peptidase [Aliiglaciecola sp. M165]|uniref:M28 family peptidase n=1 Tax=Aliiglaciecola sp. M165 TaxID=2593649 RepID=UPI00163D8B30|nr:M28 family peptidase [Aliiglaciecola sp. M165]